jgi:hypothetical protein
MVAFLPFDSVGGSVKRALRIAVASLALAAGAVVVAASPASAAELGPGPGARCNVDVQVVGADLAGNAWPHALKVRLMCNYGPSSSTVTGYRLLVNANCGTNILDMSSDPTTNMNYVNSVGQFRHIGMTNTGCSGWAPFTKSSVRISYVRFATGEEALGPALSSTAADIVTLTETGSFPPEYPTDYYTGGATPAARDVNYPSYACKRVVRTEGTTTHLDWTATRDAPSTFRVDDYEVIGGWTSATGVFSPFTAEGTASGRLTVPAGPYAAGFNPPWNVEVRIRSVAAAGHAFVGDSAGSGAGSESYVGSCMLRYDPANPEDGATAHTVSPEFVLPDAPGQAGYVDRFKACMGGAGLLSFDGLVKVLPCILRVGFEPSANNAFTGLRSEVSDSVIGKGASGVGAVSGSWSRLQDGVNAPSTCTGTTINLPIGPGRSASFSPFQTCEASTATMAGWVRKLALFGLYFLYAVAFVRLVLSTVGWGMPLPSSMAYDDTAGFGGDIRDATPGRGHAGGFS